jgi:transposase
MPYGRLSLGRRIAIVAAAHQNVTLTTLARRFGVNRKTIARYKKAARDYPPIDDLADKPRTGRPRASSPAMVKRLLDLVKDHRDWPAAKLALHLKTPGGTHPSKRTVERLLKVEGYQLRERKEKPLLSAAQKKRRLNFAKANLNRDWTNVLFSDETTYSTFMGPKRYWLKPDEEYPIEKPKHPAKLNFFGSMGDPGFGSLFSFKETLTGDLASRIVERHVVPSGKKLFGDDPDDWVFQHDNDPKWTSRVCRGSIAHHGLNALDWPANSPDLNPIENVWHILKSKTAKHEPTTTAELEKAVSEWKKLGRPLSAKLIGSMKSRLRAVIKAKGGHTKY